VEVKALPPANTLRKEVSPWLRLYFEFNHLKGLYRQGWLEHGIPKSHCESVAEHTLGVAVLAMMLAEAYFPHLDLLKVLRMALLHDFGEIYTGDLTPADGVSVPEKRGRERQSVSEVFKNLPHGKRYLVLWEEFEAGSSPEARFVKQVDRLEMAFQASVYAHQGYSGLEQFFASAQAALRAPQLLALWQEIQADFMPKKVV